MAVIVEIRRRGGQLIERCRCEGNSFSVGRAYDNDVIVDDPFVSPHHIRLDQCQEGWKVTDLDSLNGYRVKVNGNTVVREVIHSGDKVRLGHVTLRIFNTHHPVAPAVKLNGLERRLKLLGRHKMWPFILIGTLGFFLLTLYLRSVTDIKPMGVVNLLVNQLVQIGGVALVWALAGRIFRHQLRFFSHLSLWALYFLFAQLADDIADVLGYNASSDLVSLLIGTVLNLMLLAAVVWSSLSLATNLRSRGRFWAALSASVIYLFLQFFEVWRFQQLFTGTPQYHGGVKPPIITWAPSKPEGAVFTLLDELFDEAEKEAAEAEAEEAKEISNKKVTVE